MKGVVKLIASLLALFLFATLVVPAINKIPGLSDLQATIKKWDINTAAFFYTDEISTKSEIKQHTDL